MNRIEIKNGIIKASLDLFSYREDGMRIIYAPALDISGYGQTLSAARQSFEISFSEYLRYTIEKGTLEADLQAHGWKPTNHEMHYLSPDIVSLLRRNQQLRKLIQGNYQKESKTLSFSLAC